MEGVTMEAVTPGNGHLDTVRALHQTVVSLRTALEVSKSELKALKQKYEQHSSCLDYANVIEKLALENHILRRKIIDSGYEEKDTGQNIQLQVTYSPRNDEFSDSEVIIKTATNLDSADSKSEPQKPEVEEGEYFCGVGKLPQVEEQNELSDLNNSSDIPSSVDEAQVEESKSEKTLSKSQADDSLPSFKTKLELLSKFDVRIKVRTIKEGTIVSSTTSETDSTTGENKEKVPEPTIIDLEETQEHFEKVGDKQGNKINFKSVSTENIKMAVPNEEEVKSKVDKFDVQVRITSEESLVVEDNIERQKRKDTLNLDVDDLSLRSLSEGDNSVFSEGGNSPADPRGTGSPQDKMEENASGNESEEVDDIELIFTTDESRDMSNLQEDLVSIKEAELWQPTSASTHSTPVLIKFHTLDPDLQSPNDPKGHLEQLREKTSTPNPSESSLRMKRVSLPNDKEIRHVAFTTKSSLDLPGRGILKTTDNKSDFLFRRSPNVSSRKLDSVDSLSCDYTRGLSFDTKSSSFELGSSMDMLTRGDSVDSFHKNTHLGHRFSVFAETDISKCGISEENLAHNLYLRRNTCPNPFSYRPASRYSRPPGPLKPPASRPRPVLRDSVHPRRENAAQTEVSALPPRWSSDGYLAYKLPTPQLTVPSVPQRVAPPARKLLMPHPRPYDTRPALSDIGFTSMVPELSRSADPLWAMTRRVNNEPSCCSSTSTAKYMSRSSFRSPCLSVERSNEWIAPPYTPPVKTGFRSWRASLPDVRHDDTDDLLDETDAFLRRSIDDVAQYCRDEPRTPELCVPYIPSSARNLRLGHKVKLITPQGRVAVGTVRYVGLAGDSSSTSSIVVGAEFLHRQHPGLPRNDGTHHGRRYFLARSNSTALFVPFTKVVMAWAN